MVPPGSSLMTAIQNDTTVQNAIAAAQQKADNSDALVAVVRDQLTGSNAYTNYDMVMYINLTGVALAGPAAGISLSGLMPLSKSFPSALATGGVSINPTFGGSGTPNTIMNLPADAVWVTLVPTSNTSLYVYATIGNSISGTVTPVAQNLADGKFAYIYAPEPAQHVGAAISGFQTVATSSDGKTLYAVGPQPGTSNRLLIVANASDLTQRQTFSLPAGATAVAVSPTTGNVYVTVPGGVAVFTPTEHPAI